MNTVAELPEDDLYEDLLTLQQKYDKAVYDIQKCLRLIATEYPEIPSLIPDGLFSSKTTEAVKAFQSMAGLEPTGIINYQTWTSIIHLHKDIVKKKAPPYQLDPGKNVNFPVMENDEQPAVYFIQLMLHLLSEKYSNMNPQHISGKYDRSTMENIKQFQQIAMMEPTGHVDRDTWNSLSRIFNNLKPSKNFKS